MKIPKVIDDYANQLLTLTDGFLTAQDLSDDCLAFICATPLKNDYECISMHFHDSDFAGLSFYIAMKHKNTGLVDVLTCTQLLYRTGVIDKFDPYTLFAYMKNIKDEKIVSYDIAHRISTSFHRTVFAEYVKRKLPQEFKESTRVCRFLDNTSAVRTASTDNPDFPKTIQVLDVGGGRTDHVMPVLAGIDSYKFEVFLLPTSNEALKALRKLYGLPTSPKVPPLPNRQYECYVTNSSFPYAVENLLFVHFIGYADISAYFMGKASDEVSSDTPITKQFYKFIVRI